MPAARKRGRPSQEEAQHQQPPSRPQGTAGQSEEEEGEEEEGRRENTLTVLTRRFIDLIKSREGLVLDINEATMMLGV